MTVQAEPITFASNGSMTPGYLARPADDNTHPAIVVIQEYWGLVPHIEEVTRRFAENEFIALAPDLYYGRGAEEPDEARKLAMALDRRRAVAEILAAARYLAALPAVQPAATGLVGWCMGGGLALSAAAEDAAGLIGAAVAFYGRPLSADDVARLSVPVLALYGGADHGIPVHEVEAFEEALAQHRIVHQVKIYRDAPHAFFNDTRNSYRPEAARDAWRRTIEWFRTYLK
ncbi:MAG: dienelactone hydrolase family protein [Rudaea sp.]